jgi:hypothetical protein
MHTHYAATDPLHAFPIYTNYFVCEKLGDVINSVNDNGASINNINGKLNNVTIDANQNFVLSTPLHIQYPLAPFNNLLTTSLGAPNTLGDTTLDMNLAGNLNVEGNITQMGGDGTGYNKLNTTVCDTLSTNHIVSQHNLQDGQADVINIGSLTTQNNIIGNTSVTGNLYQPNTNVINRFGNSYVRRLATSYIVSPLDLDLNASEPLDEIVIGSGQTTIILNGVVFDNTDVILKRLGKTKNQMMDGRYINQVGF